MTKDKTAPQRVARYKDRMRAKGFVTVEVWVKAEDRDNLLKYVQKLRQAKEDIG